MTLALSVHHLFSSGVSSIFRAVICSRGIDCKSIIPSLDSEQISLCSSWQSSASHPSPIPPTHRGQQADMFLARGTWACGRNSKEYGLSPLDCQLWLLSLLTSGHLKWHRAVRVAMLAASIGFPSWFNLWSASTCRIHSSCQTWTLSSYSHRPAVHPGIFSLQWL